MVVLDGDGVSCYGSLAGDFGVAWCGFGARRHTGVEVGLEWLLLG